MLLLHHLHPELLFHSVLCNRMWGFLNAASLQKKQNALQRSFSLNFELMFHINDFTSTLLQLCPAIIENVVKYIWIKDLVFQSKLETVIFTYRSVNVHHSSRRPASGKTQWGSCTGALGNRRFFSVFFVCLFVLNTLTNKMVDTDVSTLSRTSEGRTFRNTAQKCGSKHVSHMTVCLWTVVTCPWFQT